jgi:dihydropteroate synthase
LKLTEEIISKIGTLEVGDKYPTRIMGVINLTQDSFYSGSVRLRTDEVKAEALRLQEEGANILDLGARSTAPYKKLEIPVSVEEKILGETIRALDRIIRIPISADTTRLEPTKAAISAGAVVLNNVHGLMGPDSEEISNLVASKELSLIATAHEENYPIVHSTPIERVVSALTKSMEICRKSGIGDEKIIIDPGIGFFKDEHYSNLEWNCNVIANLEILRSFGLPVCVGLSRKKFLGQLLGDKPPEDRLLASISASAISVFNGAHIIRTHDVRETKETAVVAKAVREKRFIR